MKNIKVKPLTKEQLIISIDRLTRFKKGKYLRVFIDVITSNIIYPQYKKFELERMDPSQLRDLAQYVINYSLESLGFANSGDFSINKKLKKYEQSVYNSDAELETFLDNEIDYKSFINLVDENSVKNLRWLKAIDTDDDIENLRYNKSLLYPIKEVVIAEGATEEILLPVFAKYCGYDFDKVGVYVVSAGGKNQVVKLYYELSELIKLPIFILLDKDAKENLEEIKPRLRDIDKIHLLACGEFEDLLPLSLIKRTLDYELSNISIIEKEMLEAPEPRTKILEDFFKTRGMHEFKKAEFARMVKNNITGMEDISSEIREIINEIKR